MSAAVAKGELDERGVLLTVRTSAVKTEESGIPRPLLTAEVQR